MTPLDRRQFLGSAAAAALVGSASTLRAAESPNEKIVLAVMGINGRGGGLAELFAVLPGAEVAYLCDVDQRAVDRTVAAVGAKQSRKPEGVRDFRKVLDDQSVDALVIATPDHWHAPATLLACAAGKHVYVEKPACHNPREGELMIEAARKHQRIVQLGTQRRSSPGMIEAIEKLHGGAIGNVLFSRAWYNNARGPIGRGKPAPVPGWLDYDLWQGPAPEREYRDNVIHYNWHWFWHWGTGELGNNGIHALDICRWGLQVDYPRRVTSGGGIYRLQGDQETPDTHVVTFDFGDKGLVWEGRSWHRRGFEGSMFGMAFYGDRGSLVIADNDYVFYDPQDKETSRGKVGVDDRPHLQNFLDCIRSGNRPHAEIEDGVKSTLLCHLGNIAHRTGRTVDLDSQTHRITGDPQAEALWSREYRVGWEPQVG